MTPTPEHHHRFRLNTDGFIAKGPQGDFFMYCSGCDEHPTVSDIQDAVNGYTASQERVRELSEIVEAVIVDYVCEGEPRGEPLVKWLALARQSLPKRATNTRDALSELPA